MTARPILAALAFLALASPAQSHEVTKPAQDPDETRLSVVLDASGALSLQLEGPEHPPPGPWRTNRQDLAADIRLHLPLAENPQVHFRGSPDASYGAFVDVLAILSAAGYRPRTILERRK